MMTVDEHATIGETFFRAVEQYARQRFLAVPANPARAYDPAGREISYRQAANAVLELMRAYAAAGYGVGHRIALLMENRPEHLLHKLAVNALGACCVPLNPDHRPREMAYVLDHAKVDLVVVLSTRYAAAAAGHGQAPRTNRPLWVLFERVRRTCNPDAQGHIHQHPGPKHPPACSTPQAPPAGPRAACCRTATSWKLAAGTRRAGGLAAFQARAATASTTRCRCFTSTPRYSRFSVPCFGATARCRPIAFNLRAGGRKSTNPGPRWCTTLVWSCRCCWASRRAPGSAPTCALLSAPAWTRSATTSSRQRFGFP